LPRICPAACRAASTPLSSLTRRPCHDPSVNLGLDHHRLALARADDVLDGLIQSIAAQNRDSQGHRQTVPAQQLFGLVLVYLHAQPIQRMAQPSGRKRFTAGELCTGMAGERATSGRSPWGTPGTSWPVRNSSGAQAKPNSKPRCQEQQRNRIRHGSSRCRAWTAAALELAAALTGKGLIAAKATGTGGDEGHVFQIGQRPCADDLTL